MDKQTLSNYGWIIILVLILAVLLALASPFGLFVSDAIKGVTGGFWDVNSAALNVAGIDTGDVGFDGDPEKCGIEGHYIGDDKGPHGVSVTDCKSGHTYTCECDGWTVPDGCKYYVGVTSAKLGDYTGTTKVYNAGEKLPCGYVPATGDTYVSEDYEYKYNYYYWVWDFSNCYKNTTQNGWGVRVLDNTKTSYGQICESIANKPIVNMQCTFESCTSLKIAPAIPSKVKSIRLAFDSCASLEVAPIIPSGVTNMEGTFGFCKSLTVPPDMSNATLIWNMTDTFTGCTSLKTAPIIPSSVTDMDGTFSGCTSLTSPPDMSNATNVMNMEYTFASCTSLETAPIIPNNVMNISFAFYNCTSLKTAPIIPSNVMDMEWTFYKCESLITPPNMDNAISVINMNHAFYDCKWLTKTPIIPNSVTDMNDTFSGCKSLTGTVEINANPTSYSQCFYGVNFKTQNLTFDGDSTILDTLGSTGINYCKTCNGCCSGTH